MKLKFVIPLVIIGLIVVGFLVFGNPFVGEEIPPINGEPTNGSPTNGIPVDPGEPSIDKTWISPGKVKITNFYAGARAEYPILVHNGKSTSATFSVTYRIPNNVEEGWSSSTSQQESWVIIADMAPVIAPQFTEEILVVLDMPEGAVAPGPKWEFWVSVKDTTQKGMVVTELCSRWLVEMRS